MSREGEKYKRKLKGEVLWWQESVNARDSLAAVQATLVFQVLAVPLFFFFSLAFL